MNFKQKLEIIIKKNNSLLCIGLDPDLEKIPNFLLKKKDSIFEFNIEIIKKTHDLVCAYKPNIAFYEAYGLKGLSQLKKTVEYIKYYHPEIPIILDAKRADIGNASKMYAKSAFGYWNVDAITVNPYLGFDSIEPFLEYKDKGVIILCKTSNPGAKDFQDSYVSPGIHLGSGLNRTPREIVEPLYLNIARNVVEWDKKYKNCLMVIGATWPNDLKKIRKIAPNMYFLVPGIGAQKGEAEKAAKVGVNKDKSGIMFNVGRSIIYDPYPRKKASELKNIINRFR
ncbi:MAG: orotidine-5'-phosphate decarboxylase [Candidatus Levybacteria bacterium]|nr:orotidine-5'-phosphate decarboxylase [Candidatus Levybacteria bacterium]